MKAEKDNNFMANSNVWLDTDSNHSQLKSGGNVYENYGEVGLEETARFELNEEDKSDLFTDYFNLLKEDDKSLLQTFLDQHKDEIEPKDRDIYVYLLVLTDAGDHYSTVNDFFDNLIAQLDDEDAMVMQELPEEFNELKAKGYDRDKVRDNAFSLAIAGSHKAAIHEMIVNDGPSLVLKPKQLAEIYEINLGLVYKCLNEQVKIDRPKTSVTNVIIESFREEHNLSTEKKIFYDTVTYVDVLNVMLEKGMSNSECRKVLSKITDKNTLSEIVGLLIVHNRGTLMVEAIHDNNIDYDSKFVKLAIENDSMDIAFQLRDMYPQSFAGYESEFLESIILSFTKSNHCWLAKFFLLKSVMSLISYHKAEGLLLGILIKIERGDPKDSPLYFTPNVLLLILNMYEICILFEKEFPFLSAITEKIVGQITKVGSNFIESMQDEERLRSIVFERDFENRDSLELISQYDIREIMDNKNMEKIALELWSSDYDVKGGLMECSSALTIINHNSFNKPRDLVQDYMFFNFEHRKLNKYAHHLFQFEVWKKSMKAKFITEAIFLFILTILFQYFLIEALKSGHELQNAYDSVVEAGGTQAEIDAALEEHHGAAKQFREDMEITEYLSIISFFYPLRIVLEMLFAVKTNRSLSFINLTNALDVTVAIVFSIRLAKEYVNYQEGIDSLETTGEKDIRYFENIYEYEDDEILLDILYSIAAACLWIRILYMFRLTRFLGPLLKMIYNMIWDIGIFMVLFTILLIIYASIGTLLFYSISNYADFWSSMVTLFGSALGGFDLNQLDDQNKGEFVGELFIISFVILCNILILNLLIAILSSTYAMLEEKKLVLYINEILRLRASLQYDERATGLVSTFPPWNIWPLLMSPLYFMKKDTTKLNNIIFHICYAPVMVLVTLVFTILNFILLPGAYLKGIFVKFQFMFNKKVETPLKHRILTFILFVGFGWVIVFLNMCVDIVTFVHHLYQPKIRYRKEKSKVQFITSDTYNKLQLKLEKEAKNGVEVIPFEDFSEYMRSYMGTMKLLQQLIFGGVNQDISIETQLFLIKEYGRVKNTLDAGSIQFGSHKLIYPSIWRYILKELKINAKIRKILSNSSKEKKFKTVQAVERQLMNDRGKEHLKSFLHICMGEIHAAITATKTDEVTLESIKETFETVLFERSDEGKAIKAKEEFKSPFRRTTTLMSQKSNRWNVKDSEEHKGKAHNKRMSETNRSDKSWMPE